MPKPFYRIVDAASREEFDAEMRKVTGGSVTLKRLIEEVRREKRGETVPQFYDRVHSRHNRSQ